MEEAGVWIWSVYQVGLDLQLTLRYTGSVGWLRSGAQEWRLGDFMYIFGQGGDQSNVVGLA
jgi:hypothetical protein